MIRRIFPNGPYEFLALPSKHDVQPENWTEVSLDTLVPGNHFAIRYESGVIDGPYEVTDHGDEGSAHPWVEFDDGEPGNLWRHVRRALDRTLAAFPVPQFEILDETTEEDAAAGVLNFKIKVPLIYTELAAPQVDERSRDQGGGL